MITYKGIALKSKADDYALLESNKIDLLNSHYLKKVQLHKGWAIFVMNTLIFVLNTKITKCLF